MRMDRDTKKWYIGSARTGADHQDNRCRGGQNSSGNEDESELDQPGPPPDRNMFCDRTADDQTEGIYINIIGHLQHSPSQFKSRLHWNTSNNDHPMDTCGDDTFHLEERNSSDPYDQQEDPRPRGDLDNLKVPAVGAGQLDRCWGSARAINIRTETASQRKMESKIHRDSGSSATPGSHRIQPVGGQTIPLSADAHTEKGRGAGCGRDVTSASSSWTLETLGRSRKRKSDCPAKLAPIRTEGERKTSSWLLTSQASISGQGNEVARQTSRGQMQVR